MAGTPDGARRQAFDEATEWLILLQEDPHDAGLRARFEAWRKASGLNAEAWLATARTSQIAAAANPAHIRDWGPAVARRRAAASRKRLLRPRRLLLGAGALALAACIGLMAGPILLLRLEADYLTETAELRSLDLEDGSRVTLGPASAVAVAFASGERRLRLLRGQAFFEVRPDPSRPFRVEAGTVEASVLGTSFDVRFDGNGVTVAVAEGVVQVTSAKSGQALAERLLAGDTVHVPPDGGAERHVEPPASMAAWRRGQLLSHDRPMGEAVDMLRRYWGGTIVLADRSLGQRPVTGVYNLADPEEALRGIVQAHGGRVRRVTPWLLVVTGS